MSGARKEYRYCPCCAGALQAKIIGAAERGVCVTPDCGFVHWNNPVPVLAAIVEHGDAVILANNQGWPPHMFGLITGFLEPGETPEQGMLREVKEELGLMGEIAGLVGVYPFAQMNQVIIAYHVRAAGTIELGAELRACKHVDRRRLRAWDFGTGHAVRDWLLQQNIVAS